MPELPDVAEFKRYIDSTSLHHRIVETEVLDERILEDISPQILGRRVKDSSFEETYQHGKFLFLNTGQEKWVVMHFGMTGNPKYFRESRPEYSKVIFRFENGFNLAYVCVRLLGLVGFTDDLQTYIDSKELGLHALDEDLDIEHFKAGFKNRRAMLKSLLLDQSFVAGIGNIYADEILFQSRISPKTRANELQDCRIRELYKNMRAVLEKAVSDSDSIQDHFGHSFIQHRDPEADCPRCGKNVEKITVSGRTTYYCPNCQVMP